MKYITRTVWILSLVSLFNDTASEMLYPVLPVYLKSIGFSILLIGILEGIAEATAGLSKSYFGKRSDSLGKRMPFVQWGYALNAVAKPMMAVCSYPLWIFFARTTDRFGKGIRTGACDAILSNEATPQTKAKIFGFHRSMDTFGAVLGPVITMVMIIAASTVMGSFLPPIVLLLLYLFLFPMIVAFMAFMIKRLEPQV